MWAVGQLRWVVPLFIAICALFATTAADAAARRALVIGIDGYADPDLAIPGNRTGADAIEVANVLTSVAGYDTVVTVPRDADKKAFAKSLTDFSASINDGDLVVVFYSGHGVEFGGDNYFLMADAEVPLPASEIETRTDLQLTAVSQRGLLEDLRQRHPGNIVLIINACRDSVGPAATLGTGDGAIDIPAPSAHVAADPGTMVIYATSSGKPARVCLDRDCSTDTSPMTVFTRRFVEALKQPNLAAKDLTDEVSAAVEDDVTASVNELQLVSVDDQISNRVKRTLFLGPVQQVATIDAARPTPPPPPVVVEPVPTVQQPAEAAPLLDRDLTGLYKAARAEGQLNVIALPHDWCAYGAVIDGFKQSYPGIKVREVDPDAGSADEIAAIKANSDKRGPNAPDVVDIGPSVAISAATEGLLSPYRVQAWNRIPAAVKDGNGYWYADYFGVIAFLVNTDLVPNPPSRWADLTRPEYAGQFALGGDPRSSNQSINAVLAAGLSAGGDLAALETPAGAGDVAKNGLARMAALKAGGTLAPLAGRRSTAASGATPILAVWDYNGLAWRGSFGGNPNTQVIIPSDAALAGYSVQAISAFAPHPNAARLWMEYIYSDAGQLAFLSGYCHPILFDDLASRGQIPAKLADAMPPASAYAGTIFLPLGVQEAARKIVTGNWDAVVGLDIR